MKRLLLPSRWALLSTALVVLVAAAAVGADEEHEFDALKDSFWEEYDADHYEDAERIAGRLVEVAEKDHADDPERMAQALRAMASVSMTRGRLDEAEKLFQRVAEIRKESSGADDPWYGDALGDLAHVYRLQGRYAQSVQLGRQALAIMRAAWGDDDEDVRRRTRILAGAQIDELDERFWEQFSAARYGEAEKTAGQMIELGKSHGDDEPELVTKGHAALGSLHNVYGRLAEAETVFTEVAGIWKRARGETDGWYGNALADLADVYHRQGRHRESQRLYHQALDIMRTAWGDDDEDVVRVGTNLADVDMAIGDYSSAESLYRKALEVFESTYGRDAPELSYYLLGLAEVYRSLDRYAEAEQLAQRALRTAQEKQGTDHAGAACAWVALARVHGDMERRAEATANCERALAILEQVVGAEHPELVDCLDTLAYAYNNEGRYVEAERAARRSLAIQESTLGPAHLAVADALVTLGTLYVNQTRYLEAEILLTRALAIQEKSLPSDSCLMTDAWAQLGVVYANQGRYADADDLLKRVQTVCEKVYGADNFEVADALLVRGQLYMLQSRYDEAEKLLRKAGALLKRIRGEGHSSYGYATERLATLYLMQERGSEALQPAQEAVQIVEAALGPDALMMSDVLATLAAVYAALARYDEAKPLFERSLALIEHHLGPDSASLAYVLLAQASALHKLERGAEAEPLLNRAIAIQERAGISPAERAEAYSLRAQSAWNDQRRSEALADLRRAIELAEEQRGHVSGAERERAGMFSRFLEVFEKMVEWQTELGDVNEALLAIERSKARSLLDELSRPGVDMELGRSSREREELRRREDQIKARITGLERQIEVLAGDQKSPAADREEKQHQLKTELTAAREQLYQHYRDARSSNPVYRNLLTVDAGTPRLSQIRSRLVGEQGLIFVYLLGKHGGFLVAIGPETAELVKLAIDPQAADVLGIDPGPMTAARVQTALMNDRRTGVLQQMTSPSATGNVNEKLLVLWRLLVPEGWRDRLTGGEVDRLIVIPDGPLALLPFEILVVASGRNPSYLLDVGPPILYGPSASVLFNLKSRRAAGAPPGLEPVLTVGDPAYPVADPVQVTPRLNNTAERLGTRSRYSQLGGPLSRLPNSGTESRWVSQVFEQHGVTVSGLLEAAATERNVREKVAGRPWLHLACHGLVDQAHGNFFGALALTPGPEDANDPSDDGFLSLAEIYELDLTCCELAILSACETNYGPEQRGEGVWGLSRGFLVAGSRRVLASNWLVDDEAAASLVSYFCSGVARGKKNGQIDYARALQGAKRWIRQQEKWHNPYYWGAFVLLAPD